MSSTPAATSWRSSTSTMGRSLSGMSGLGRTVVYGASRVPCPPAMITAFTRSHLVAAEGERGRLLLRGPLDGGPEPLPQIGCRPPARGLAQLGRIPEQAPDLA